MFVTFVPPRQLAILDSVLLLRDEDLHEPVELAREGDVVLPSDVVLQRVLPTVHVTAQGTTELDLESAVIFILISCLVLHLHKGKVAQKQPNPHKSGKCTKQIVIPPFLGG